MTVASNISHRYYNCGKRLEDFFSKTKGVYATSVALEKSAYLIELLRSESEFKANTVSLANLNSNFIFFNSALRCSQIFSHDFSLRGNSLYERVLSALKLTSSCFIDFVDSVSIIDHFGVSLFSRTMLELLTVYSKGFATLNALSSALKNINKYQDEVLNSLEIEEEIKKRQSQLDPAFNQFLLHNNYIKSQNLQDQALLKIAQKVIQCAALLFGFTSYCLVASVLSLISASMALLRLWNKTLVFSQIDSLTFENTLLRDDIEKYKDNHATLHAFLKSTLVSYNELSDTKRDLEERLLALQKTSVSQEKVVVDVSSQTEVGSEESFTVRAIFTPSHDFRK